MPTPIKYRITSTPEVPVTTSVKGSPLTSEEIDGNFKSLVNALDSIDASEVSSSPVGGLAATNVQAALAELDSEKVSTSDLAATGGSALVGFQQSGTGAVERTVQDKLREAVSAEDYPSVQDALNSGAKEVTLTAQTYAQVSGWYVPDGVTLIGVGNPTIIPAFAALTAAITLGVGSTVEGGDNRPDRRDAYNCRHYPGRGPELQLRRQRQRRQHGQRVESDASKGYWRVPWF